MTLPVVFTANGPSGYNLTNSLRFRSSASAYLNRTPASASNRRTYTWSAWVKRSELSSNQSLFAVNATGDYQEFRFTASNTLQLILDASALNYAVEVPTVVWRDVSAWYHIVLAVDTTQATSTNRVKIYVNGIQQTVSAVSGFSFPAQNFDTYVNATLPHAIGNFNYLNSAYFNGYMTEINLIDGQALTPSSFGETSTTTGVWIPKKYTGTYGTNGFYLPFTDNSALTTSSNVGLGKDFSGNANYWTTNNISITSGSTYDSMTDVPTLTSATAANYCTLNAALQAGGYTLNDGNLNWARTGATGGGSDRSQFGTIGVTSGKWYWEFTAGTANANSLPAFGIAIGSASTQSWAGSQTGAYIYNSDGTKTISGTSSAYGASFTTGDIIGVAFDADAGTLTFYKNNTSQGTAASGLTSGPYFPAVTRSVGGGGSNGTEIANFGQRPFSYTPPTGFNRLNTFNLPTPTIGATTATTANKYMDATLYTGNSSTQTVTNSGSMQPDWVWIKDRSVTSQHVLTDSVRGVDRQLFSSLTNAEQTSATAITSFNSNGFTTGANPSPTGATNSSPDAFVAWQWRASNATAVTNTAGSITSTVSANTTAGFSIVTYTGNGSNSTVGHGLGVAPSMIIIKNRSTVTDWPVYHGSNTTSPATQRVLLNTTDATATSSTYWNNTAPTSSVFSISTYSGVNGNTNAMVAYCFAQIAGYSAFGSYTGNGSADGPFIFTGFRPRFVMIKCSSSDQGGNAVWVMLDTARNTYNVTNNRLKADSSTAEDTSPWLDINSNGFKIRETSTSVNGSSATYIYMAFAESPFKYANAR